MSRHRKGTRHWIAPASLGLLQLALYLSGMHPGVADGDSAELQWASPLLGICHSPGYAYQVLSGKLFSFLPIGDNVAWRVSLVSVVSGIAGSLALFGAVRRITGNSIAAWSAAAALAFGSVYWSQALVAEVYVFGAAFLLVAVYAATRFVQEDGVRWLTLAAVSLGVLVAERPTEILVVPAFAGLWWCGRRSAAITMRRLGMATGLFVAPFLVAMGMNILKSDPDRLAARDNAERDRIIGHVPAEVTFDYTQDRGAVETIRSTTSFMLGTRWSGRLTPRYTYRALFAYMWVLSGVGAWGDRYAPERLDYNPFVDDDGPGAAAIPLYAQRDPMLEGGVSFGTPLLMIAILGIVFWRRHIGWIVLGAGMFFGNLVFIAFYEAWDSMSFTVPGQAGLALLIGLGVAGSPDRPPGGNRATGSLYRTACLFLVLALIPINRPQVDRSTPAELKGIWRARAIGALPWPSGSVVFSSYWAGMTYRYVFWIEEDRTDLSNIHTERQYLRPLMLHFAQEGRPVFVDRWFVSSSFADRLVAGTDPDFLRLDMLRVDPDLIPPPEEH